MRTQTFKPGDGIKVHKHSNEAELIFIHKGFGLLTLGDQEYKVKQGAVALIPKGVWHGLKNTGTEDILIRDLLTCLLVLKAISEKLVHRLENLL